MDTENWMNIKNAYTAVLNNAFTDESERDMAHSYMLRLMGSLIDLHFSGSSSILFNKMIDSMLHVSRTYLRGQRQQQRQPMERRATSTTVTPEEFRTLFPFLPLFEQMFARVTVETSNNASTNTSNNVNNSEENIENNNLD